MTAAEVRKLLSLAEHGKVRDLAIYAQAGKKLGNLQTQIDALHADRRQYDLSSGGDPNTLARWQRWAESAITKLRSQHQEAESKKEAARLVAVRSFAKVQALGILLKKSLKEDVLVNRRRAEQNGQPPDA